jgi:hypothetical protein
MSDSKTPNDRIGKVENGLTQLAVQLGEFIKDTREHRDRHERDQSAIWHAIRDQGKQFTEAVEKLSTKGALSWPVVAMTIGLVLTIVSGAAAIGHQIMEGRMATLRAEVAANEKVTNIEAEYQKEGLLRQRDRIDKQQEDLQEDLAARNKLMMENAAARARSEAKQEMLLDWLKHRERGN